MSKKNCLNCHYLCKLDNNNNLISLNENERDNDSGTNFTAMNSSHCFHSQWTRYDSSNNPSNLDAMQVIDPMLKRNICELISKFLGLCDHNKTTTDLWIIDENGKMFPLFRYKCRSYDRYKDLHGKPISKVWEERQTKSNRFRSNLNIILSLITTIAVLRPAIILLIDIFKDTP